MEDNFLGKWTDVLSELADVEQKENIKWNEEHKPLKEIDIDDNQVMGIWNNPIAGYYYAFRSKKGIYQCRSLMIVPRQLWEFIVENEKRIENIK